MDYTSPFVCIFYEDLFKHSRILRIFYKICDKNYKLASFSTLVVLISNSAYVCINLYLYAR